MGEGQHGVLDGEEVRPGEVLHGPVDQFFGEGVGRVQEVGLVVVVEGLAQVEFQVVRVA